MYLTSEIKTECCGCKACVEICLRKCISIVEDSEHFEYPSLDRTKCINCHLCEKVCPISNHTFRNAEECEVWAGKYNSEEVMFGSSSGGAYTAIYKLLLRKKFIFYGVRWSDNFKVIHDIARTEKECERFRKSKYVLSDTKNVFSKIESHLKNSEKVCFSGTPCQCAALLAYLSSKYIDCENLVVVDIICHGAPNQYVFDKYISEKVGGKDNLNGYMFRFKNKIPYCGKTNSRSAELISPQGESIILNAKNDPFLRGYYGRLFYRPSCGSCQFARPERVSDISIGDAWHIERDYPEWNSLAGVSLILLNSQIGKDIFNDIGSQMEVKRMSVSWAVETNAQLREPTQMHPKRNTFFNLIENKSFEAAVTQSMDGSIIRKGARKIKRLAILLFIDTRGGVNQTPCIYSQCIYNEKGSCRLR